MTAPHANGEDAATRRAPSWGQIGAGLAIGVVGGALFYVLTLPLPWMLGPMVLITVAALLRLPVAGPAKIRPYVVVVIGVMLGSGFSPALFDQVLAWALSLLGLGVYLALCGLIVVPYYRRVGGFDPVTAYFAGMPGGLTEMMLIGRDMGGDDRAIILAHASRVMVTVAMIAIWFRIFLGVELGDRSAFGTPFAEIPAVELLVLAASGGVGFWLGRALRLPAPTLLGPMLVSAAVHIAELTTSPPPQELVIAAQIVLGTIIGARFVGAAPRAILRALALSVGGTILMLGITLGFAALFHEVFGQSLLQVVLAYAPGGLAEMSLVALAMQADIAYVASHHLVRITLVILFAPMVFAWIRRRRAAPPD
ncbi:MAG: AbrB family transcriptional regulator [Pseudomonadota bacterium]